MAPVSSADNEAMPENESMRVDASQLLMFVVAASIAVAVGMALLRTGRLRVLAWLLCATTSRGYDVTRGIEI